ncbi:MAG: TIGR04211 family SH3 domain-containing protein [Gammaproteobacteria bacterium]|jgi:SH3 domain protein|nr:TIGR04211 family SH3 domain-containing protein [Gammaproteobacteria bacterium]
MRPIYWAIIGFLGLAPLSVLGETAYVTDNLRLGLYATEDTSGRPIRMLDSGQAMEVLSRDRNYANVQLPDASEGWVKAAYLVDEKPAKLIVAEITAERDTLLAELEETKQAFAAPAATIESLKNDALAFDARLAEATAKIAVLEEENASIRGLKEQYRGSLPLSWVAIAIGVCLISGILLGMWWVDRQSRKRHGGIRIY